MAPLENLRHHCLSDGFSKEANLEYTVSEVRWDVTGSDESRESRIPAWNPFKPIFNFLLSFSKSISFNSFSATTNEEFIFSCGIGTSLDQASSALCLLALGIRAAATQHWKLARNTDNVQ
jgi:hypothetical protein